MMFKQTSPEFKNIKLGMGDATIYNDGCFLVSLCNLLVEKGYAYTPITLNAELTRLGCFSGSLLVTERLTKLNGITNAYRVEPADTKDYSGLSVVSRVDSSLIGGSGQHFTARIDKDTVFDPWTGKIQTWKQLGYRVLQITENMITPQTILEVDGVKKEWQSWQSDIRLVPKMAVDLENANKEIDRLKISQEILTTKLNKLTESVAKSQEQIETITQDNQVLTEENKRFEEVDTERKAWKSRYETALLTQINKYSGWQLVTMGLSQIIKDKWQKK